LAALDGSCRTPLGGLAQISPKGIHFVGAIASPDGAVYHQAEMVGARDEAVQIGRAVAQKLRRDAGDKFFEDWH